MKMAHKSEAESSESGSSVSEHDSAVSSVEESSPEERQSVSPPRKKLHKSHKSHKRKYKHTSESELDDEKENHRKKKKSSHQRREMKRERLRHAAAGLDSSDAEVRKEPNIREVPSEVPVPKVKRSRWQSSGDEDFVQQTHSENRNRDKSGEDIRRKEAASRGGGADVRPRERHKHRHHHKHGHRQRDRSTERTKQHEYARRGAVSPEAPVRVKEEPLSDPEHEHRRRRRRRDDDNDRRRGGGHYSPAHEDAGEHSSRHRETKRERDRGRGGDGGERRRREDDARRHEDGDRRDRRPDSSAAEGWGLHETAAPPTAEAGATAAAADKEVPNFGLSGKLLEDTNTVNGVVVKYSEPPEARKPKRRWRLYVFKGDTSMPTLHIHRQSAFLMGRDRKVADIPIDHPSCSKQHAVLQYRLAKSERPDGTTARLIKPYIIDLESANGTYVNNQRIEAKRYVELMERDVLKFGFSSREYVLLHDSSKGGGDSSDE